MYMLNSAHVMLVITLYVIDPLHSDKFSHTDKYNKDGVVHCLLGRHFQHNIFGGNK